jgi:hypothetical protein
VALTKDLGNSGVVCLLVQARARGSQALLTVVNHRVQRGPWFERRGGGEEESKNGRFDKDRRNIGKCLIYVFAKKRADNTAACDYSDAPNNKSELSPKRSKRVAPRNSWTMGVSASQ